VVHKMSRLSSRQDLNVRFLHIIVSVLKFFTAVTQALLGQQPSPFDARITNLVA
ncbi:MAG: hypothetical protein ACI8VW_001270, partial [bacterium]